MAKVIAQGSWCYFQRLEGYIPTDIRETGCTGIGVFAWCVNSMKGKSLASRFLARMQAVIGAHWKSSAFSFLACLM